MIIFVQSDSISLCIRSTPTLSIKMCYHIITFASIKECVFFYFALSDQYIMVDLSNLLIAATLVDIYLPDTELPTWKLLLHTLYWTLYVNIVCYENPLFKMIDSLAFILALFLYHYYMFAFVLDFRIKVNVTFFSKNLHQLKKLAFLGFLW